MAFKPLQAIKHILVKKSFLRFKRCRVRKEIMIFKNCLPWPCASVWVFIWVCSAVSQGKAENPMQSTNFGLLVNEKLATGSSLSCSRFLGKNRTIRVIKVGAWNQFETLSTIRAQWDMEHFSSCWYIPHNITPPPPAWSRQPGWSKDPCCQSPVSGPTMCFCNLLQSSGLHSRRSDVEASGSWLTAMERDESFCWCTVRSLAVYFSAHRGCTECLFEIAWPFIQLSVISLISETFSPSRLFFFLLVFAPFCGVQIPGVQQNPPPPLILMFDLQTCLIGCHVIDWGVYMCPLCQLCLCGHVLAWLKPENLEIRKEREGIVTLALFPMASGSGVFVKEAKLFLDETISMFSQASLQETEEKAHHLGCVSLLTSSLFPKQAPSPETSHTSQVAAVYLISSPLFSPNQTLSHWDNCFFLFLF